MDFVPPSPAHVQVICALSRHNGDYVLHGKTGDECNILKKNISKKIDDMYIDIESYRYRYRYDIDLMYINYIMNIYIYIHHHAIRHTGQKNLKPSCNPNPR